MPQRVIRAWMIVVGVVGWVAAMALVLLSAAGVSLGGSPAAGAAQSRASTAPAQPRVAAPDTPIVQTPQWQRLMKTWYAADNAASGRKGLYPFDAKGKGDLLADLKARADDADALAAAGHFSDTEAALLKKELLRLTEGVQAKRTVQEKTAAGYEPAWVYAEVDDGLRRLADRLPLLAALAKADKIQPEVVRKVLATMEADLAKLDKSDYVAWLKGKVLQLADPQKARLAEVILKAEYRRDPDRTVEVAKALAAEIRARLTKPATTRSEIDEQWEALSAAWEFAEPLTEKRSSTEAELAEAKQRLAAARHAAAELGRAGAISAAEAALLTDEINMIRKSIDQAASAGDAAGPADDQQSLADASFARLRKRLPLLQQVLQSGKLNPVVLDKVLPTTRGDLAIVSDPKQIARLDETYKYWLKDTLTDSGAVLAKIDKLMGRGK